MKQLLYIFLGSGIGGVTRFSLDKWVNSYHSSQFPFGTFVVNLTACFILGIIIGLGDNRGVISPDARIFWAIGFCGGFSTFSAISNEALTLLRSGNIILNFIYIPASVMLSMVMTFLGIFLAAKI